MPVKALLACCAVLAAAAASVSSAGADQARTSGIVFQSRVVASWGLNDDGELGDGTVTSRPLYGDIRVGNDVAQVAAGGRHGLALKSDGTVWSWGSNGAGQLGDGAWGGHRDTPVQVSGLTGVTQVAAGRDFSLALRSDGTVWAWGDNFSGQLGRGTFSSHEFIPAQVTGLAGVTKISAGHDFALALRSDGTVRAWGDDFDGQLGDGGMTPSPVPVTVAGLSQVTRISAGFDSSVATTSGGVSALSSVWTWGRNDLGQLGDGTRTRHRTPERVTGVPGYIAGISAGAMFATVLGADGSVWGWGNNFDGQLATPQAGVALTRPVNTIAAGSGITQLAAGDSDLYALKSDGTVLAWGANFDGQLGNGTQTDTTRPAPVTGLTDATQVAAGEQFALAIHIVPYLVGL